MQNMYKTVYHKYKKVMQQVFQMLRFVVELEATDSIKQCWETNDLNMGSQFPWGQRKQ